MGNILVLNMGMKSIRSIVFSPSGEKLGSASRPLETLLNSNYVLQDPVEWWEKAKLVVRESLVDVGGETVDCLTVTASSACLVCVDAHGEALGKCIMVSDKRASEETGMLLSDPHFPDVQKRTGLGADAYLMLPKILWIKKNDPERFAATYKFLAPNDFLIAKMTGLYRTDVFNASKLHYDVRANSYPTVLLQSLGITEDALPSVGALGSVVGTLTPEAASHFLLRQETRVVLTTYDAICSFYGSGVSEEGDASDVSGTVTVFRALSKRDDLKACPDIFIMPYPAWGMHIVGGSNNLGGGLIEWVKQCYYQNEPYPYEVMEKDAGEARLGADGLIFLPYLLGERAPVWNADARGVFFGLERIHTRKQMTRAVFESAGFIDLDMITAIEKTGMEIRRIRLSGGLSRIPLISQIKADVTGREIEVLDEFETTATGAAMLALFGMGRFSSLQEAAEAFAAVRMIIRPNAANHRKYQKMFQLYKHTYQTLEGLFGERMRIMRELNAKHEVRIENL